MNTIYIWECERRNGHYVATANKDLTKVPEQKCPECGSKLNYFKEIPNDGQPRIAFNSKEAAEYIDQNGYYPFKVNIQVTTREV